MSLFDGLRLKRATSLSCSPHLLQVKVVFAGEDVNLDLEEKEGVKLTGLTLTSASLSKEGKVSEAEECRYSVSLPPLLLYFELKEVTHSVQVRGGFFASSPPSGAPTLPSLLVLSTTK